MRPIVHPDPLVAFYSGAPDDRGRTLEEILGWSDVQLEATHDVIQWLFPTTGRSAFNPRAPLVTKATAEEFRTRPELRDRLRRALDRMLAFYGLRREDGPGGEVQIVIDPVRFPQRAPEWLQPHNHNHLRLTRIMQSLATLHLAEEARALQRCLLNDVYDGPGSAQISRETYEFWLAAVRP